MSESYRTTYRTEAFQESFEEEADQAARRLAEFRKNPLETSSGAHYRVIEPLSMEKLAELAEKDLTHRLRAVTDDPKNPYETEDRLEQVRNISQEIERLGQNGMDYTAQDEGIRERMSWHSDYRGERLRSTYQAESGLENIPALDQIESDPGTRENLQSFVDQLSSGDQVRLLKTMSHHYANTADTNEEYKEHRLDALQRLVAEIDTKS